MRCILSKFRLSIEPVVTNPASAQFLESETNNVDQKYKVQIMFGFNQGDLFNIQLTSLTLVFAYEIALSEGARVLLAPLTLAPVSVGTVHVNDYPFEANVE
jgi:hypothetical protein